MFLSNKTWTNGSFVAGTVTLIALIGNAANTVEVAKGKTE